MSLSAQQRVRAASRIPAAVAAALLLPYATYGQGVTPQVGIGYHGNQDVGLDDGYTHFSAFSPLARSGDLVFFSDAYLLFYNDRSDAVGANLGGGARYYSCRSNRIFDGYAYYDYRNFRGVGHNQVGLGLETLGDLFDARVNLNLPTSGSNDALAGTSTLANPAFGGAGGQNIVVGFNQFQQAFRVLDLEGGALLTGNHRAQLKGYAAAYGLFGDGVDEWGARGRLELRANDSVWLNGYVQNDDVFGTTGGFSLECRYGLGRKRVANSYCSVASRLGDPVQRRRHVAVATRNEEVLATSGGTAITVLHVDSNAAAGGTGGFQDPIDTLLAASNQSEDIVFVHGGSVFSGEGMQISSNNQRFLGEGVSHQVVSDQGTFLLPGVNPGGGTPQILNAPGFGVNSLANNMEVSGFLIENSTLAGVTAAANTGIDINRNTVTQSGTFGIVAGVSPGGAVFIRDNVSSNNGSGGIGVSGAPAVGEISGNAANGNQFDGLFVATDFVGSISSNTFDGNQGNGVLITGDSTFVGDYTGNTTSLNQEAGVLIDNFVQGDISSNVANQNGGGGILVDDSVVGDIANNTTNQNGAAIPSAPSGLGLGVEGNVAGDVFGNTANQNADGGIAIAGTLTGDLANNIANDNLAANGDGQGIRIGSTVDGNVTANTAASNADVGLAVLGPVTGDVTFNDAQENGQAGVAVTGAVGESYQDNVTSLNAGSGALLSGGVTGNFARNTANDNDQNGIEIGGDVGGSVFENMLVGNLQNGLRTPNTIAGNLRDNTASDNGEAGLLVEGQVLQNVYDNTANNNGDNGIEVFLVQGRLGLSAGGGNTANGNGGHGIRVFDVGATIVENTTSNNTLNGIEIWSGIGYDSLTVTGNTANGNGDRGINIEGGVDGNFSNNIVDNNGSNGAQIGGDINGDVRGNQANSNTSNGMVFQSDVLGGLLDNVTNDNGPLGGDGVRVNGDLSGNISGNTAIDNDDDGIDVDGTIGGVIGSPTPNSFSGNADQDIEN